MQASHTGKKNSIVSIYLEGWRLSSGMKAAIFRRFLLFALLMTPVVVLQLSYVAMVPQNRLSKWVLLAMVGAALNFIFIKVWIPAFMMGVRRAIGLSVDMSAIKTECEKVSDALFNFVMLFVGLATVIGLLQYMIGLNQLSTSGYLINAFITLIVQATILMPLCILVLPLLIIRRISLMQAIEMASNKFMMHWNTMLCAYTPLLLMPLLLGYFLAVMGFGVGAVAIKAPLLIIIAVLYFFAVLWLIPLFFAISGVLFRDIYGLKIKEQPTET